MKTKEIQRTRIHEIWVDDEGILWTQVMESNEVDLDEVMACFEIYKKLGIGEKNKVLQIMDARNSITITKEAREYAAVEGKKYFTASAIVSNSLAIRLIVNFINSFYKDTVPLKLFADFESALKWLRAQKKTEI